MKRINKRQARKEYAKHNENLVIAPCNMQPSCGLYICLPYYDNSKDFDKLINTFIYYNCNYETGYYPAYYLDE